MSKDKHRDRAEKIYELPETPFSISVCEDIVTKLSLSCTPEQLSIDLKPIWREYAEELQFRKTVVRPSESIKTYTDIAKHSEKLLSLLNKINFNETYALSSDHYFPFEELESLKESLHRLNTSSEFLTDTLKPENAGAPEKNKPNARFIAKVLHIKDTHSSTQTTKIMKIFVYEFIKHMDFFEDHRANNPEDVRLGKLITAAGKIRKKK